MSTSYLRWLADLLEEAQVPLTEESAPVVDRALRHIAGLGPDATGEEILAVLRRRWLRAGPSGRQLLAGLLRGQVYARRDSPLRPTDGHGHFVNP